MKKLIVLSVLSLFIFACSHKTASSVSSVPMKTSSATVTEAQYLQGKTVFEANCQKCHKLRDPRNYTMKRWEKLLNKMAPRAKLTPEQKQQVHDFVSVNAKPA